MEPVIKTIAFDVYGVLLHSNNLQPRLELIELLKTLKTKGHKIVVWTDSDPVEAEFTVKRLKLTKCVDIAAKVAELLLEGKKVLFLISGGSATQAGLKVLEQLEIIDGIDFANLAISLVDERWEQDNLHADSNWLPLAESELVLRLSDKGAELVPVLHGGTMASETARFNEYLLAYAEQEVVALFGMGEDGHTAGIFPASVADFATNYGEESLAVSHEVSPKATRTRITISPKMINLIKHKYLFAAGEGKREMLKRLIAQADSSITPADIAAQPSLLLRKAEIYTDQEI